MDTYALLDRLGLVMPDTGDLQEWETAGQATVDGSPIDRDVLAAFAANITGWLADTTPTEPAAAAPDPAATLALVTEIAATRLDGELDDDGEEIIIENDDAWTNVWAWVTSARGVLGLPEHDDA